MSKVLVITLGVLIHLVHMWVPSEAVYKSAIGRDLFYRYNIYIKSSSTFPDKYFKTLQMHFYYTVSGGASFYAMHVLQFCSKQNIWSRLILLSHHCEGKVSLLMTQIYTILVW